MSMELSTAINIVSKYAVPVFPCPIEQEVWHEAMSLVLRAAVRETIHPGLSWCDKED